MLPAATTMAGNCFATPDVCNTPSPGGPVPVPYPNTAQMSLAVGTSTSVFVNNMPAVTLASKIPISSGDEAGTAGGVVSGVFIQQASFSKGSSVVMVDGMPWVHLTSMSRHNGVNANMPLGAVVAPSQSVVLVSP